MFASFRIYNTHIEISYFTDFGEQKVEIFGKIDRKWNHYLLMVVYAPRGKMF